MKMISNRAVFKKSFFYTFILGLAAHAYCFLNMSVCHDSLNSFYIASKWPKAALGRIFYAVYIHLTRGNVVLPWMIGILGLCWISLGVYLISRILKIENNIILLLVAGICVTNPSMYATAATYLHDFDANALAMLLAVASVALWQFGTERKNVKQKVFYLISASILLSVSLGIYQSFVSVAITLIILISVMNLLNKEYYLEVLIKGTYGIGILAVSAILYMLELKIFTKFTGIEIVNNDSYNGLGNLAQAFSGNIFEKILDTYKSFVDPFKSLILTSDAPQLMILLQGIIALGIIVIALYGMNKLEWKSNLLIMLLAVMLPFGMNISSFLSNGMYHVLMQYAVWFIYLIVLMLLSWGHSNPHISQRIRMAFAVVLLTCIGLIVLENIQTANTIYMKKNLEYEATLAYMTNVSERMEAQEAYVAGETPVVFIGEVSNSYSKAAFEKYEIITGVEANSPITFHDTYKNYFRYVLGMPISLADISMYEHLESVLEMPCYPAEGCMQIIDGTLVVKLN